MPFWLSAFVVVTAWLIRRTLSEPPAYLQREKLTESPLVLVFKHHKRAVLTICRVRHGQHCEHGLHDFRAVLRQ